MARAPSPAAVPLSVHAVVLGTDGVVLDSALVQAAAWKKALDACLATHEDQPPFDEEDEYRRHVDGRAREDGAAAFLTSRGLGLPEGSPDDPPGTGTVRSVAARKDEVLTEGLRTSPVPAWPGTVRLLRVLNEARVPCAATSASRRATELLSWAGLLNMFAAVVDGGEALRPTLPGPPDPAVLEDHPAGVQAARRGGFGLVAGVDRTDTPRGAAGMRRPGTDLVVSDPGDLLINGED